MKHYTDFNLNGQSYEAIGLSWDKVEEILGHKPTGTSQEDEEIVNWIVEHSEYSKDWLGEGTTDEEGYYIMIDPNSQGET